MADISSLERKMTCWDTLTGHSRQSFDCREQPVWLLALSPDGRMAISGCNSSGVRCWYMETGKTDVYYAHEYNRVTCFAFSPDGRQIVSAATDGEISIWDLEKGKLVVQERTQEHDEMISVVAISPSGNWLASGSDDTTVIIWDTQLGQFKGLRFILKGHTSPIVSAEFSQDDRMLATGCRNHVVRVWEAATGTCKAVLGGFNGSIETIVRDPVHAGVFHVVSNSEKHVCRWMIQPNGEGYTMSWCWGDLDEGRLNLSNVSIEGSRGLSDIYARLMEQRRGS
jgi:WD40 repeat protein